MKFLQKYVLVPKEEWEKVNPHLKNQKQLDIVREKKKVHLPKVVKNNSQKVVKKVYRKVTIQLILYQTISSNKIHNLSDSV